MSKRNEVPREVLRRMLRRAAEGEKAVVVTFKGGVASRVYGVEQYMRKQEVAKRVVKPWTRRRQKAHDPLGAIDGEIRGSLSRSEIGTFPCQQSSRNQLSPPSHLLSAWCH